MVYEHCSSKRRPHGHVIAVLFFGLFPLLCVPATAQQRQNRDSMETITVANIVLHTGSDYDISIAPSGYRIGLIRLLRRYGFNALGGESAVFDQDKSSSARYWLGATIEDISCDDISYKTVRDCEIQVMWELMDSRSEKVRYRVRTRYFHPMNITQVEKDFPKMIGGSLKSLMKREKFVDALQRNSNTAAGSAYSNATVKRCSQKMKLPVNMNDALDATVVIREGAGTGSGFFISDDGYIVTANHVVSNSNAVNVKTHSGEEIEAVVVRRNPDLDVALLQADIRSPSCFALARQVDVGVEVYGIGAPAGEELAFSVSRGIVSGVRALKGNQYVQTDTSLNPGNSGGPLVNPQGEVIALVSWKLSVPGFEGIAFGVPVVHALEQIAVVPDGQTTISKAEIDAAKSRSVQASDDTFVDVSDRSKLNELRAKRATAKRNAQQRVRKRQADEWRRAEEELKRDELKMEKRRRNVASIFQKLWFFSSMTMVVGGAAMVGGSYGKFKSEAPTDDEFNRLKSINSAGWVLGGIGLGSVVIFYSKGYRLRSKKNETMSMSQRERSRPRVTTMNLSLTGIMIQGRF